MLRSLSPTGLESAANACLDKSTSRRTEANLFHKISNEARYSSTTASHPGIRGFIHDYGKKVLKEALHFIQISFSCRHCARAICHLRQPAQENRVVSCSFTTATVH